MSAWVWVAAAVLIAAGFVGAIVPAVPGIPLIFVGLWLLAGADQYRHVGMGWLIGIAVLGTLGVICDLLAGALGAKRAGASTRAIWGAALGAVLGLFFGIPGLLLGPFIGAVLGELSSGKSILRSAGVGLATWVGLLFGTLVKLVASVTMVAAFGMGWWWNRGP